MKLYESLAVQLTYQNFGSTWILILRGDPDELAMCDNGLFNRGATNGEIQYQDTAQTVGLVWSSRRGIEQWFYKLKMSEEMKNHPEPADETEYQTLAEKLHPVCHVFAAEKIQELRSNHENFLDYRRPPEPTTFFSTGVTQAEKPDLDMKDAILTHAYSDRDFRDFVKV